jgi:hypothetical protein
MSEPDLVTEENIITHLFDKDSRPSVQAFGRLRRSLELPHIRLGRKVYYFKSDISKLLKKLKR